MLFLVAFLGVSWRRCGLFYHVGLWLLGCDLGLALLERRTGYTLSHNGGQDYYVYRYRRLFRVIVLPIVSAVLRRVIGRTHARNVSYAYDLSDIVSRRQDYLRSVSIGGYRASIFTRNNASGQGIVLVCRLLRAYLCILFTYRRFGLVVECFWSIALARTPTCLLFYVIRTLPRQFTRVEIGKGRCTYLFYNDCYVLYHVLASLVYR